MADEFKRLKRDLVYKGAIVDFYKDTIQVPNGNIVEWDFIRHQGAAAVVPVREDGRLLMVRQYRNALDRYTLEIPAGGLNGADEPTQLIKNFRKILCDGFVADDLTNLLIPAKIIVKNIQIPQILIGDDAALSVGNAGDPFLYRFAERLIKEALLVCDALGACLRRGGGQIFLCLNRRGLIRRQTKGRAHDNGGFME